MRNTDKILLLDVYLFRLMMVSGGEKTGELMKFVTELFWKLTRGFSQPFHILLFSIFSLWET